MKNFFFLLTVFLFLIHKQTIAQLGWHWAASVSSNNNYTSENAITTDVFGNVYVTGAYNGTVSFGTTTLSNSAGGGMYLVKYDALGNVLWAKTQEGTGSAESDGISTDPTGNVFVTGGGGSTVIFGTYTLTTGNVFIVKFDPNGNVLWAKSAGGGLFERMYSISTDSNGNAFVTGYFGSASFTIGTYTLSNPGLNRDVFIAKYDPNGNVLWAKAADGAAGGPGTGLSAYGKSISTDAGGNAVITGYFLNSAIIFGTYTLTHAAGIQLFVTKYDPNGNVLWAKKATGGSITGNAVSTDPNNGSVFLTGRFESSSSIVFDTYILSNTNTLTANIFVAKYDVSGNVLWVKALEDGESSGICTNFGGDTYVTGYYNGASMVFGTSTLTNNGAADMFVVKYDAIGDEISAVSAGGSSNDYGWGIAADSDGNVFVTGNYNSPAVAFGTTTLNNTNTNTNYHNAFVGKLGLLPTGITPLTNPPTTLLAYPNPFQDKLLINSGELRIDKLSISNLLGELILQQNNYNTSQALDLSTLPSGIYFLKVESEKEQRVAKIIKE